MRQLPFLHSPWRHTTLSTVLSESSIVRIPTRNSSLSAIHRGLRKSERSRPQGFKLAALESSTVRRPTRNTSRSRRDPNWKPPSFTLTKGKKDITGKGPQPKSRRFRFNDSTEGFGKRSLVYQLKHGPLKEKLEALIPEDAFGKQANSRGQRDDSYKDFKRTGSRHPPSRRDSPFLDRSEYRGGHQREGRWQKWNASESSRDFERPAQPRRRREYSPREEPWSDAKSPRQSMRTEAIRSPSTPAGSTDFPLRLPRTTAASQFLYGRSVVEAALKSSRRKLYNLYLYAGEGRQNPSQDTHLERLAERKDVKVTRITNQDGLRMMDKMSSGRPHNGCVLESSPLPQPPLRGLGHLSNNEAKPGFSVELSHQSSEDAAINGTDDFISYPAKDQRRPFFLLLDGVLDPGNLGGILRTAAFLGVTGVAITTHHSATLTPVALKASAGAAEVLPLYSVPSTLEFIEKSKEAGWTVYAAVPPQHSSKQNSHLSLDRVESYDPLSTQPSILVIGSEGEGLSKPIRRKADFEVSIPSPSDWLSEVDSLNVSVATGLLCAAFLKRSHGSKADDTANLTENEQDDHLW